MKIKLPFLLFVFSVFYNFLFAQTAPVIQWQKCLGGSDVDVANCVHQTSDGGFIVIGSSRSNDGNVSGNHGLEDEWVVRLNPTGNIIWQKCLGGSGFEEGYSIQETSDHGFVTAGYESSNDGDVSHNHGDGDYWIVKLDSSGNINWEKSFGGSQLDQAKSIQQTFDGGFIVGGFTWSQDGDASGNNGYRDAWILKLSKKGSVEWEKFLLGSEVNSIQQTADHGFIAAGSINNKIPENHGGYDYLVAKLDSAGNLVWQKCFGGSNDDKAYSVSQTNTHDFIVAGYSDSNDGDVSGNGGENYWILKLDSGGNLIWQKCIGGRTPSDASSAQQTSDGDYIVLGSYDEENCNYLVDCYDYDIVKLDGNGNIVWQSFLGGNDNDFGQSVEQTTDGGFILGGWTASNDLDVSGNHGGFYDYWVVKLSPEIITSTPYQVDNSVSVYSNPTQNKLTVDLSFPTNESTVSVYDEQGRNINSEFTIDHLTGNSIQLNTQHLPPGFYTIQIINKKTGQQEIEKFVKE